MLVVFNYGAKILYDSGEAYSCILHWVFKEVLVWTLGVMGSEVLAGLMC